MAWLLRPVVKPGIRGSPSWEPALPPAQQLGRPLPGLTPGCTILPVPAPLSATCPAPHAVAQLLGGAVVNLWPLGEGNGENEGESCLFRSKSPSPSPQHARQSQPARTDRGLQELMSFCCGGQKLGGRGRGSVEGIAGITGAGGWRRLSEMEGDAPGRETGWHLLSTCEMPRTAGCTSSH